MDHAVKVDFAAIETDTTRSLMRHFHFHTDLVATIVKRHLKGACFSRLWAYRNARLYQRPLQGEIKKADRNCIRVQQQTRSGFEQNARKMATIF
jgi:hypothetical protein